MLYAGRNSRASVPEWQRLLTDLHPILLCPVCSRSACTYWTKHPLTQDVFRSLYDLRADVSRRRNKSCMTLEECERTYRAGPAGRKKAAEGLFYFLSYVASVYPDLLSPFCRVKPQDTSPRAVITRFLEDVYTVFRQMDAYMHLLADVIEVELSDDRAWTDSASLLAAVWLAEEQFFSIKVSVPDRIDKCISAMTKKTRTRVARRTFASSRSDSMPSSSRKATSPSPSSVVSRYRRSSHHRRR